MRGPAQGAYDGLSEKNVVELSTEPGNETP